MSTPEQLYRIFDDTGRIWSARRPNHLGSWRPAGRHYGELIAADVRRIGLENPEILRWATRYLEGLFTELEAELVAMVLHARGHDVVREAIELPVSLASLQLEHVVPAPDETVCLEGGFGFELCGRKLQSDRVEFELQPRSPQLSP
jgi:hypothetical protein